MIFPDSHNSPMYEAFLQAQALARAAENQPITEYAVEDLVYISLTKVPAKNVR
jgi:hypothetical protein